MADMNFTATTPTKAPRRADGRPRSKASEALSAYSMTCSARVHSLAHTTEPTVAQQAAIENALSMALHFMRQSGDSTANLWGAIARTNRALTLLKHVSQGLAKGNIENVLGRA